MSAASYDLLQALRATLDAGVYTARISLVVDDAVLRIPVAIVDSVTEDGSGIHFTLTVAPE